ncbi:hypothetical protein HMI55_002147 [Coelomomyces lativittatus]|nr:hypothetical protein HMI55_002147 [Coelomomyces lativittatus]
MSFLSIDYIEFRKELPDVIGEQRYDSIKIPLSMWTDEKINAQFRKVYSLNFDAPTILNFFPMNFVSEAGRYNGSKIFKDIAHQLLPCLHNINKIKKHLEYFSQKDVVVVSKCKSILMDLKSIYYVIDPLELFKVIVGDKALTNVEHKYWQLRFLQLPQLLILEWVFFLNDPEISIENTSPSHSGIEDNKELLKPYLAYLEYILQIYKAKYPHALLSNTMKIYEEDTFLTE